MLTIDIKPIGNCRSSRTHRRCVRMAESPQETALESYALQSIIQAKRDATTAAAKKKAQVASGLQDPFPQRSMNYPPDTGA